jgi:O-acetyl-ADP-ribose deacetylase (regulator of RNase III)
MEPIWCVRHGDVLDVVADVLVCPANVYLNLSGGVGGAFLMRYGPQMQESLWLHLATREVRHVERGDVIEMEGCGSPFRAVLHAVAVDGAYESSSDVVTAVVTKTLRRAAEISAETVALSALGTGYGRLTIKEFARAIRPLLDISFPPIKRVVISLRSQQDAIELGAQLKGQLDGTGPLTGPIFVIGPPV